MDEVRSIAVCCGCAADDLRGVLFVFRRQSFHDVDAPLQSVDVRFGRHAASSLSCASGYR